MMRWAALLLAVAAASKQKDSAPHDAKKKDPTGGASLVHAPKKPVAVCVSGLARAFYAVPRVQRNAWSHMVWPIVEEADVFFVLDASTRGRTGGVVDAAAAAALAREARALWRPVYDVALESAGLEESLAACFGAIAGRERARRRAYAWVLRLRPDATYGQALPPYPAFPDLAPGAAVAWAAYLGGATCGRGVPADFDRTGACLDDNWALLSRGAADAYLFGREWPLRGERAPDCVQTGCAECRLGCALRRAGARPGSVDVRLALERPRADGSYAADGPATAVDLAAAAIVEARLAGAGDDADAAAAWRAAALAKAKVLKFLVVEVCAGGYVQVPYAPGASDGAAAAVHGIPAPLATPDCDPPPLRAQVPR